MKPTVGRNVHYHSATGKTLAAIVTEVDRDHLTLTVFTIDGPQVVTGVLEGDRPGRWEWMPYQKGQATKTESHESELEHLKAGGTE